MTESPWELPEGSRWTSVWEVTSLIQTCGNDTAASRYFCLLSRTWARGEASRGFGAGDE